MFSSELVLKTISGGVAGCMGRLTAYPFDVVQQNLDATKQNIGTYQMMKKIVRQQGVRGLFKGCGGTLAKQMLASTICLGGYDALKCAKVEYSNDDPHGYSIAAKLSAGFAAGAVVNFTTMPRPHGAPLVKLNIVEELKRAYEKQIKRGSHRKFDYRKFYKKHHRRRHMDTIKQRFINLCKNTFRSGLITIAEVVSYDIFKEYLIKAHKFKDDAPAHFLSAIYCGVVTVLLTSPYYAIHNRFERLPPGTYLTMISYIVHMHRKDGISAFYPAFGPTLARAIIFNLALWMTFEQLKRLSGKYKPNLSD